MIVTLRVLLFAAGVVVVVLTTGSALRTVVLPRGVPATLGRIVFLVLRSGYALRMKVSRSYAARERVMASFGPATLLVLLQTWLVLVFLGYTAMYAALGDDPLQALRESGSSLFTLGFDRPAGTPAALLAFSEASTGLVLLALLITYLPSLYAAFSRREAQVTKLEVRAGSPPSGAELLWRVWSLGRGDLVGDLWATWEDFFVDIEETHTSFPALTFFRSPQPEHSWVTAAGAVLDGAALLASSVEIERDLEAELSIRAGSLALRHINAYWGLSFPPDPSPDDPISVQRSEYDEALERMAAGGVPLRADRETAWRDFAGWRVNYDVVLLNLATLTMAPYAPWSSDRSAPRVRPPVLGGGHPGNPRMSMEDPLPDPGGLYGRAEKG